jgi:hypothetical protein
LADRGQASSTTAIPGLIENLVLADLHPPRRLPEGDEAFEVGAGGHVLPPGSPQAFAGSLGIGEKGLVASLG